MNDRSIHQLIAEQIEAERQRAAIEAAAETRSELDAPHGIVRAVLWGSVAWIAVLLALAVYQWAVG